MKFFPVTQDDIGLLKAVKKSIIHLYTYMYFRYIFSQVIGKSCQNYNVLNSKNSWVMLEIENVVAHLYQCPNLELC